MEKAQTLHSLNAIRVIAEYAIVHHHIFGFFLRDPSNALLISTMLGFDLMSLFFVLSGFVCMYANRHADLDSWATKKLFYIKKMGRVYPLYLMWLCYHIALGATLYAQFHCPLFWLGVATDITLISPWLLVDIARVKGPSWYLAVLIWLWLAFPWVHAWSLRWFEHNTWRKIGYLYVLSFLPWIFLVFYPWYQFQYSQIPVWRMCEFMMGMGVNFTLDRPLPNCVMYTVLTLLVAVYTTQAVADHVGIMPCVLFDTLEEKLEPTECHKWSITQAPHQEHCVAMWDVTFKSKTSILWALIIHCLASAEIRAQTMPMLQHDIFKTLSWFSLQLYLGHNAVFLLLRSVPEWLGIQIWQQDTMMLAIYAINYLIYATVQPRLDSAWQWIFQESYTYI